MLESSSDWPTRERIEWAVINQYERLECEKSATGSRGMLSARGHRRNDKPPIRCPLCSCTGHFSAMQYREFQISRREKKPNEYQRDGEHGGNVGGGENIGGGRNGGERCATTCFQQNNSQQRSRADARLPRNRHRSTPFRPQYARFPLPTPRNWPPRNQGPPSRRYEGAVNGDALA